MQKILYVIANQDFKDVEYRFPHDALMSAGFEVVTASKNGGECRGKDGMVVEDSVSFDVVEATDFVAIVTAGGTGCLDNVGDEKLRSLIEYFVAHGVYGAICLSPRIALYDGLVKGYKVTGWDGDEAFDDFVGRGESERVKEDVIVDRNVITANGPDAAEEFGQALITVLSN